MRPAPQVFMIRRLNILSESSEDAVKIIEEKRRTSMLTWVPDSAPYTRTWPPWRTHLSSCKT